MMVDGTWELLYAVVSLLILLIGGRLFKEEILKSHTDTGSALFLVAIFWLPLLYIAVFVLSAVGVGWLFKLGNEIEFNWGKSVPKNTKEGT